MCDLCNNPQTEADIEAVKFTGECSACFNETMSHQMNYDDDIFPYLYELENPKLYKHTSLAMFNDFFNPIPF